MSSETVEKDSKKKLLASEEAAEKNRAAAREDDSDDEGDDEDEEESNGSSGTGDSRSKERASFDATASDRSQKIVVDRPSSAKMVWTLAKREIGANLNSPITYIVIAASLVLFGLWFFFYKGGFWQIDRASMQRVFDTVPGGLCFLTIPLFTMRTLSDEKRVGTIELLITMPVKDSEVILGKFFGALSMVTLQIALIAAFPLVMFTRAPFWHLGELDWSPFWVGMLGLFLLSAAGTAIGVMWSSFTESQILSFFATMLTLIILYAVGSVTIVEFLQGWPGDAISFISLQSRFEPFARGMIDSRAIIYFLSLTTLGLVIAFRSLESRKWS
jgi:ABC-2 type transport system permease protein